MDEWVLAWLSLGSRIDNWQSQEAKWAKSDSESDFLLGANAKGTKTSFISVATVEKEFV